MRRMGESRTRGCLVALSNGLECQASSLGCWLFPGSGHLFWSTALSGSTCPFCDFDMHIIIVLAYFSNMSVKLQTSWRSALILFLLLILFLFSSLLLLLLPLTLLLPPSTYSFLHTLSFHFSSSQEK